MADDDTAATCRCGEDDEGESGEAVLEREEARDKPLTGRSGFAAVLEDAAVAVGRGSSGEAPLDRDEPLEGPPAGHTGPEAGAAADCRCGEEALECDEPRDDPRDVLPAALAAAAIGSAADVRGGEAVLERDEAREEAVGRVPPLTAGAACRCEALLERDEARDEPLAGNFASPGRGSGEDDFERDEVREDPLARSRPLVTTADVALATPTWRLLRLELRLLPEASLSETGSNSSSS